jgi:hypothetical protein
MKEHAPYFKPFSNGTVSVGAYVDQLTNLQHHSVPITTGKSKIYCLIYSALDHHIRPIPGCCNGTSYDLYTTSKV